MELQSVIDYCFSKKTITQEFPFDDSTMVFKVAGKMFTLINLKAPFSINLKCDPEYAIALRQTYTGVIPGYYMNKKHWNTILLESDVPAKNLLELIDHSYELVISKLPKAIRDTLLKS